MLNLRGVHVFEKVANTGQFRLRETHTALRFGNEMEHLFIQDGMVFDAGGKEVKDIPEWFKDAVKRANPAALREAGWKGFPKG